eukprot:TRINITY_DN3023_c0_g1_i2.p1 TRINITY_DN3023_c0_g1~~TRINITY_DN3023_c0_g1_i2.p1  ORF type:complete len:376 (+),score=67.91 TRINITY_DN3023_c0_g1_i2:793-1920(+)
MGDPDLEAHKSNVSARRAAGHTSSFLLACGGKEGNNCVLVLDARTHAQVASFPASAGIWCTYFIPSTTLLAAGLRNGQLMIINLAENRVEESFKRHSAEITTMSVSPNHEFLLTTSRDDCARCWRLEGLSFVHKLRGHSNSVYVGVWNASGTKIVTGSYDDQLIVHDTTTWAHTRAIKTRSPCYSGAFNPRNDVEFFVGLKTGELRSYNIENGQLVRSLAVHSDSIWSLQIGPSGTHILTGSDDGGVAVVDFSQDTLLVVKKFVHKGSVPQARFAVDGRGVHTVSRDGSLRTWDLVSGEVRHETALGGELEAVSVPEIPPWERIGPLREVCVGALAQRKAVQIERVCVGALAHRKAVKLERLPAHLRDEIVRVRR